MKRLALLVQDLQKILPPGCSKSEIVVYYFDDILDETDYTEAELVTYIKCCEHGERISQLALHVNELMRTSAQNISLSEFVADNLSSILEGTNFTEVELIQYSGSYGVRLNQIATEVERRMKDAKQGTSKIDIARSLAACEKYSKEDIERYINSDGARKNQIASDIDEMMENTDLGTSRIDIARSLVPCKNYSKEDIERYIKFYDCCDESLLEEKYDLVKVEQGGKDSIKVKCRSCGEKRWTHYTLRDGSSLKVSPRNSFLMGLQWNNDNDNRDSVVLERGFGRSAIHAKNEVRKFFGENHYLSQKDLEAIGRKVLSNGGREYLPVYNQKRKAGRVEIGRISFAPNNSSKPTIVVGSCRCSSTAYDPVDENHGRELVHLEALRARKEREINSDDEEEGGEEYYKSQTTIKLRELCSRRGLKRVGKKQELVSRLIDNDNDDDENHNL